MAMALYPEAQRRAQAEIDSLLTMNVFPDFNHRRLLPYVEAILRETLRWHSVAPLGSLFSKIGFRRANDVHDTIALPHSTCCDDVFDGYLIPKGAWHDLICDDQS